MPDNGTVQANVVPGIQIVIEWRPATGQIQIGWPAVDDVIKLGLLEMAKQVLSEGRLKAGLQNDSRILVPRISH